MTNSIASYIVATFVLTLSMGTLSAQDGYPDGFIGTYTQKEGHVDGKAEGIYAFFVDDKGAISKTSVAAEVVNPSFVTVSHDGKNLFAVSEVGGKDGDHGFLYQFKVDVNGEISLINRAATGGMYPCHVATDSQDRMVFVANYAGGVDVYSTIGSLEHVQHIALEGGTDHPRQESSHPHMAKLSPDDKFLYVPDLGSNRVWIFEVDYDEGSVTPAQMPSVMMAKHAGPRHMSFNPVNGDAYVINELNNTVAVYSRDNNSGALVFKQSVSTLPGRIDGDSYTADIHVHPNGKFVFGSNRGHNSIVAFEVGADGKLTVVGFTNTRGDFPRNFALDSKGHYMYVANQNTGNLVRYGIDVQTGELNFLDEKKVKTPVCVAFTK